MDVLAPCFNQSCQHRALSRPLGCSQWTATGLPACSLLHTMKFWSKNPNLFLFPLPVALWTLVARCFLMAAWHKWSGKGWDASDGRDYSGGYQDGFASGWQAGWDEANKKLAGTAAAAADAGAPAADDDATPAKSKKKKPGYVKQWYKDWYADGCADLDKYPRFEFWDDQVWQPYKEDVQELLRASLEEAEEWCLTEIWQEMDVDGWKYELRLFPEDRMDGPDADWALSAVREKYGRKTCTKDIVGVQKNMATGKERPVRVLDN